MVRIDTEIKLMVLLLVLVVLFWRIEPKEWPKAGTVRHDHITGKAARTPYLPSKNPCQ